MKTTVIGENLHDIKRVFPEDVLSRLSNDAGYDGNTFSKEQVIENKELFSDTEYIFSTWGMPVFSEEEIKSIFPALKCVFYAAGSVQSFARPFLNCGVKVFSAWAANAIPVAEYTTAQIILANKGYFMFAKARTKDEVYIKRPNHPRYTGNYEANVGIIGAGMIGKLVINMLKSHNLNIYVFDPFLPDEKAEELGVKKTTLEEIFSKCNVVTNHLANNAQTKGMLNGKLFESMLPFATFINTGRGAQVIEDELIKTLKERPDLTALLDVVESAPPKEGSALYLLDNCHYTPHIAGSSGIEVHRMAEYMYEEYLRFENGEATRYEVTEKMLETMA